MVTHWVRDKMAANYLSTFFVPKVRIKNDIALVQLMTYAVQATSHYLNQWRFVYWRLYASLGLSELGAMAWQFSKNHRAEIRQPKRVAAERMLEKRKQQSCDIHKCFMFPKHTLNIKFRPDLILDSHELHFGFKWHHVQFSLSCVYQCEIYKVTISNPFLDHSRPWCQLHTIKAQHGAPCTALYCKCRNVEPSCLIALGLQAGATPKPKVRPCTV